MGLNSLGIGIGLRPYHYEEILRDHPPIDWFEIISENYLDRGGYPLTVLERILERYPVVQHGVSLGIGNSDPLDFEYLKKLKALTRKTKTPWLSDHLCWGQIEGAHFHDLLPLPMTRAVMDYVADRARIVQDYLEIPFALENVSSYATFEIDEMAEWEFYGGVIEKGGIKMMLDINNLYVSSRNHHFDPTEYYRQLPLERVIQIHLAGHTDLGSRCIDTHNQKVVAPVWELYGKVIAHTGPISTLLEWDDDFISLKETHEVALKAKDYYHACTSS